MDRAGNLIISQNMKTNRSTQIPAARKVCGFTMRPIGAAEILLLQQINSPLLAAFQTMLKHSKATKAQRDAALVKALKELYPGLTDQQASARLLEAAVETFFVLTQPAARCRQLLQTGRDTLKQAALEEILDKLPITGLADIQLAMGEHLVRCLAAQVDNNPARN
jgi:hypothetical protein